MLHAYAVYLRECCNVMQDLQYLEELEIPSDLRLMASKLPYKLRERWRTTAYETQQRTGRRIRLQHLVDFVEKHAKMLLDPLFEDIQDQMTTKKSIPRSKSEPKLMRQKQQLCYFSSSEYRESRMRCKTIICSTATSSNHTLSYHPFLWILPRKTRHDRLLTFPNTVT